MNISTFCHIQAGTIFTNNYEQCCGTGKYVDPASVRRLFLIDRGLDKRQGQEGKIKYQSFIEGIVHESLLLYLLIGTENNFGRNL